MDGALCVGLMSGTSMDAVDAALCRIERGRVVAIEAVLSHAYEAALRRRLLALQTDPDAVLTLREFAALDHAVGAHFAETVLELLRQERLAPARVRVIGSHGQTVFHDPLTTRNSLQIGDSSVIAARTGVTVAADFRRADIARGGQGAPLVPAFHQACFSAAAPCAILNLGGIANLTLLDAGGSVTGFDTGPGNGLLDAWIESTLKQPYDDGGAWARSGEVNTELLDACLADPYFTATPPKSTGRDHFNLAWLRSRFAAMDEVPAADVQRSLSELTARTIALQLRRFAPATERLLICGGGVRNRTLVDALRIALDGVAMESTAAYGIDPGAVEPAAFAWLGWRRIEGLTGSLPTVTGASGPAVLGALYAP